LSKKSTENIGIPKLTAVFLFLKKLKKLNNTKNSKLELIEKKKFKKKKL
jgi:hypothetical protein